MVKEFLKNREVVYGMHRAFKELDNERGNRLTEIEIEKRDKISEIRSEYSKKEAAVQEEIEAKKNTIDAETQASQDAVDEIKALMKLLLIKNSLTEPVLKYDYSIERALENRTAVILSIDNFEFFELHTLIHPNDKPKNRFDLNVYLLPKHFKLLNRSVFDNRNSTFKKPFATKKEAKVYYEKNYQKMIAKAVEWNKEMVTKTEGITFDPLAEFDFNMFNFSNYSGNFKVDVLTPHKLEGKIYKYLPDGKEYIYFTVIFDPKERVFKINTTDEEAIKGLKTVLEGENEHYDFFWIDNPVIISI